MMGPCDATRANAVAIRGEKLSPRACVLRAKLRAAPSFGALTRSENCDGAGRARVRAESYDENFASPTPVIRRTLVGETGIIGR